MENRIKKLEDEIEAIKSRNRSVEIDKKWEISWLRRILIAIFTYLSIGIYMWAININLPWLNAIVPTAGFLLSTLSMPYFKKLWIKSKNAKS